jgi:hypothetical protein
MTGSDRLVKLYKIDKEKHALQKCRNSEEVIVKCINLGLSKQEIKTTYSIADLSQKVYDGVKYYLFVHNYKEHDSDWADFLPSSLIAGRIPKGKEYALILFIDDGTHLFVSIGGYAYSVIVGFIDHSFGLTVLSKLMRPTEDEIISISSRGMTGLLSGSQQQYRTSFKVIDYIRFGRIPTEIHLRLNTENSILFFDFLNLDAENRILLYAGKYFMLKQRLSFAQLRRLIFEISHVYQLDTDDYLNSYSQIPESESQYLWDKLIEKLYINIDNSVNDFDIVNEKVSRFYEADDYILKEKTGPKQYHNFMSTQDRSKIWPIIRSRIREMGKDQQIDDFKFYLFGLKLYASSQAYANPLKGNFIYQIDTELKVGESVYFLISGKWYNLRKSFIDDLKNQFQLIASQYLTKNTYLDIPWDKRTTKTEGEYNKKYINRDGYVVLDTITGDNIELCDILHFTEDTTYLVHVKYGFASSTRELVNQIEIAAKRLSDARAKNDVEYYKNIYRKYFNKSYSDISEEDFINLFDLDRTIVFVLAFTSQLMVEYSIRNNPEKYGSNIAKYSVVTCVSSMQSYNARIEIYQIPRS